MRKYFAGFLAIFLCVSLIFAGKSYGEVFGWPTPGYTSLSTTYYYPDGSVHSCRYYYGGKAAGIDIRVPSGTEVLAPAAGTVQSLADLGSKSFGRYFEIKHDNGTITLYAHLSEFRVSNGQRVKRGDVIALSGSTGNSTGPHLHYEMSDRDTYQYYQQNGYKDPRLIDDPAPDDPNPPVPPTPSTIEITTDSNLPTTTKGTYFDITLQCTGNGSTYWTLTGGSLPGGISLNNNSGHIGGYSQEAGTFRFTIQAKNDSGTGSKEFTLTVNTEGSGNDKISITTDSILPDAERGGGYDFFFKCTGNGNSRWTKISGSFPPGLYFDELSGHLGGNFSNEASGTYTFTLKAENESGSAEKTFTINVNSIKINTDRILPNGEAGSGGYDFHFSCTGNGNSWWDKIDGSFPPNLEFDRSGRLYGKFSNQTGTWTFTLRASNDSGEAVKTFTLTVREHREPFVFSGSFNDGKIGEYYSNSISVSGGASPYTLEYGGNIPEGLSMTTSGNQFVLSGTPSKAGSYSFSIKASDNEDRVITGNYAVTIEGLPSLPAPVITTESLPDAVKGSSYYAVVTATGEGAVTLTADGLPNGLTFSSGIISGTPTVSGIFTVTVYASNSGGLVSKSFSLKVEEPSPVSTETTSWGISNGKLIIETNGTPSRYEFDPILDTNGDGFVIKGLPAGLTIKLPAKWGIDTDTSYNVDVSDTGKIIPHTEIPGLPSTAHRILGSNTITLNASDIVMTAFIFTAPTITTSENLGNYKTGDNISVQLAAEGTVWSLKWTAEGLPGGLTLDANSGLISGSINTAGTYSFTVKASNCAGEDTRKFTVTISGNASVEAPKIITKSLPEATEGQPYNFTLEAEGTNLTWSSSAKLPGGLTLSQEGIISGTPTTTGIFRLTFTVKNSSGNDNAALTLNVKSSSPTAKPRIKTSKMPDGFIGEEYNYQLEAEGTVNQWYLAKGSTLPLGLELDAETGAISGIIYTSSAKTFRIKVIAKNDAGESSVKTISIKILARTPYFKTETLKAAKWGKSYSFTVRLANIKASTWGIKGDLPEGIKFANGKFSGKPKEVGDFDITITVSNGALEIEQDFTLRVASIPPKLKGSFKNGKEGKYYYVKLKATGTTPIEWDFDYLPEGLTFTTDATGENCIISGTPQEAFSHSVAITLTNGDNHGDSITVHKKLTIKAVTPKIETRAADVPDGTVNARYSYQLKLKDGYTPSETIWDYTGNMPDGLTLDQQSGLIYGVPEKEVKNSRFTVYARNAAKTTLKAKLVITMTIKPEKDTNKSLPSSEENQEENTQPRFENGIAYHERGELTAEMLARSANNGEIIAAILPAVEVEEENVYEFTVSLDISAPEGGLLVWHSYPNGEYDEKDAENSYFLNEKGDLIKYVPDTHSVTVNAWLKPGIIYEPVIAVKPSKTE